MISTEKATEVGCEYFLRHATLDMDGLAVQLAVSRATLYRVVNSRDRLLGEVLWRLAEQGLARARAARTLTGVEGVLEVTRHFSAEVLDSKTFARFLADEPEVATRVLFTPACRVYRRAVATTKEIFAEAAPPDGPWLQGDLDNLAYLYVRIFESAYYAEMLAGVEPDRELAERTARALLNDACQPLLSASRLPKPRQLLDAASCLVWTAMPAFAADGSLTLAALAAR